LLRQADKIPVATTRPGFLFRAEKWTFSDSSLNKSCVGTEFKKRADSFLSRPGHFFKKSVKTFRQIVDLLGPVLSSAVSINHNSPSMRFKLLRGFWLKLLLGCGLMTGLLSASLQAQTPTYSYVGTSNNIYPLQSSTYNMCQWLFTSGDFTPTPPTGVLITTIYLKPSNIGTFSSTTFTNLLIKMGSTSITSLTSGTWNGGLTTVLNASSYTMNPTSSTWIPITLTTPFLYTGSNFIVEISQQGYSGSGLNIAQGSGSGNRRMYGSSSNTGSTGADASLLTMGFDAAPANCSGTPLTPLVTNAAFPAASPLCAGATVVLNATDPNLPVNGIIYQWQSAPASTGPWTNVTTGSGATTLSYTTGPISANTYFRIGATCTNSSVTTYSAAYLVPIGSPQPGVITGPSTYCPGDPQTYSVPAIAGGVFTWTLPTGWTGFSTSNSITVTPGPGTTAQTLSVQVTSSCGPISIARNTTIALGSAPSPPGTISGNSFVCGNTAQTYSVLPVGGAMYYTWTTPTGWVGTSTTNTINLTASNSGSGSITVRAVNGCGQSSVQTLPVTVIASLPNPGTITGSDTVCSGSLLTYSINPVPGATSYTWTLPSGWSGTTTGTSIQAFAGSTSGTLRVTAYVSCATSPVSNKNIAVVTTVNPTVAISAPLSTLCQGTTITLTALSTFPGNSPTYQWKKNGINVTAFGNIYTTNSLMKGDSVSVTMVSNSSCASNTTANSLVFYPNITPSVVPGISINTVPPINICAGTSVTFTTTSNGTGTAPTYQWYKNNLPIPSANGTSYTDAALKNADTLSIGMVSNAVCATTSNASSNKVGVHVTDPVAPTVTISVSPSEVVTPGEYLTFSTTFTDGGPKPDFQWQKNGVDIPFETGDTYTTSTLVPGDNITVRMLSYAPCVTPDVVMSNIIVLKSAVSVANVGVASNINLYPNPNNGRFTLAAKGWNAGLIGQQVRVDVISSLGQSVYHVELSPSGADWKTQIDLGTGMASGRYMLRISSADGAYRSLIPFVLNP
jgi:hypothetical protein